MIYLPAMCLARQQFLQSGVVTPFSLILNPEKRIKASVLPIHPFYE
jgi:hypothetical protein